MSTDNYEAVILEPKARVTVRPSEKYTPGKGELLIQTTIVSVSPFEAKFQQYAPIPIPYPANFGVAYAGTIEATGPEVTGFALDEHVAVFANGFAQGDNRRGAHQRFVIAHMSDVAKVNPTADPEQTSTVMSNITTVIPALSIKAGLDRPSASPNPQNRDKKVLIYGGTTQLGRLSVQYARSAGYSVVTTTSPQHATATAALSPVAVVDHTEDPADVAAKLIAQGPYTAVFDTVSIPSTQEILATVLRENAKSGATNVVWAVGPAFTPFEGVTFSLHAYPALFDTEAEGQELRKWLLEDYVPGLYNGTYSNVPGLVEKAPGGLNAVQILYDQVLSVSGKKLVYSPWDQ